MAREGTWLSEGLKYEPARLVDQPGARKAALARELGIGASLLGRWCSDANVNAEVTVGQEGSRANCSWAKMTAFANNAQLHEQERPVQWSALRAREHHFVRALVPGRQALVPGPGRNNGRARLVGL